MTTAQPVAPSPEVISFHIAEKDSGVWWKFAREGLALLLRAFQEAQAPSPNTRLIRGLYLDSVVYFLGGLPEGSSCAEKNRVRSAALEFLLADLPAQGDDLCEAPVQATPAAKQPWIECTAETITYHILLGIALTIPRLRWLVNRCRWYNERYDIWPRIEARCTASVESVALTIFRLASVTMALKDGKRGKAFKKIAKCCIKDASRGVWAALQRAIPVIKRN